MARSRFVWHVFAGFCALIAAGLTGCFWLASVQMAGLADASQLQRVADAAAGLTAIFPHGSETVDPAVFADATRRMVGSTRAQFDLLSTDGTVLATSTPGGLVGERSPVDALVEEARAGRIARSSRYDAVAGKRILVVAAPVGPADQPAGVVRVTADTSESDAELSRSLRWLLLGFLSLTAAALAAGLAVASRLARPVADLSLAAARLADGDTTAPIPAVESVELAELADAIGSLREQLVERGLTIGRQGTQQEAVLGSMIEGVLAIDARHAGPPLDLVLRGGPGRVQRNDRRIAAERIVFRRQLHEAAEARLPFDAGHLQFVKSGGDLRGGREGGPHLSGDRSDRWGVEGLLLLQPRVDLISLRFVRSTEVIA